MLSSLIAFLKVLRQKLSECLAPATQQAPAPACPRCGDPLCGVMEMSYRRDSETGLQTQSVWIRVDTRKLLDRILENPDINLDALPAVERRGSGVRSSPPPAAQVQPQPQPPAWHQKLQRVVQAPPAATQPGTLRRRIPPPPNYHH